MRRLPALLSLLPLLAAVALAGQPAPKDPPPKKLTAEEKKDLEEKLDEIMTSGGKALKAGRIAEALRALETAAELVGRLYPDDEYPRGHPTRLSVVAYLAALYDRQGMPAAAERRAAECVEIARRMHREDHPDLARYLNNLAATYQDQGKFAAAEPVHKEALAMRKRLYPRGHPAVVGSLSNLGTLHEARGNLVAAEEAQREALAMVRRLFPDDHPEVALTLNNLASVCRKQGKFADAQALYTDALDMRKRLHPGDHAEVARSLNSLSAVFNDQGKSADAVAPLKAAVAMLERLADGRDRPDLARSRNNLGLLYHLQGKPADAGPLLNDSLAMRKRLFAGQDHPDLAVSLNNVGLLEHAQDKLTDAEARYKDALALNRRLHPGDHPAVTNSLCNLAALYLAQGRYATAEPLFADAAAMSNRLTAGYARAKSEGEALTFTAALPRARDGYLTVARLRAAADARSDPAAAYPAVWAAKGSIARVFEQRHLRARAASADPALAVKLAALADARRRRAERLLVPAPKDPDSAKQREADLKAVDERIVQHDRELADRLPDMARIAKLDAAAPTDLRKVLPADAALVDYVRYILYERDDTKPVGQKDKRTLRYVAFVVTRDKVAWVDLEAADKIEPAVAAWREAITGGGAIPAEVPVKVRELVWGPVRKHLPAGVNAVYVCPDAALCRLPFAALPGDKADTILLDDFAVATVPHAPFLLDQLWPADKPTKEPPTNALVVGGVAFDAKPEPKPEVAGNRSDPLTKDGAKLNWGFLPGTEAEAGGFKSAAEKGEKTVVSLTKEQATAAGVLTELPKARIAHIATHGYFADPSVRSALQPDPADYRLTPFGERVGRVANSPLLMTGLVFAGANDPKAAGRGVVTGEALVDLDLSGLELAVLSACETGLGDVAGGEGVFGLQRAFHLAGARNVVASLWKVPDRQTAALMGRFYHHLWDGKEPPVQALRKAQLDVYRNPIKADEWAKAFRGATADGPDPVADAKTAHPRLWAAFTLSGLGR